MKRRAFFKRVAIAVGALAVIGPERSLANAGALPSALWLRRDGEAGRLDIDHPGDYRQACWLLRDTQAGREAPASLGLLRTAAWMQAFLALYGVHRPFDIHSGYRTKLTNDLCDGARASQHLLKDDGYFHAMDIHMDGIPTEYLGRLAALAHQGGVGFYTHRQRGFVHIDNGRVRYWRG
jgi:hypothetical protein